MADTITADKLCALTGLTDRRHRQLAKAGYFPPPKNAEYDLALTVKGLFDYYRQTKETRDVILDARVKLIEAQEELARSDARRKNREEKEALHELYRESEVLEWLTKKLTPLFQRIKDARAAGVIPHDWATETLRIAHDDGTEVKT